MGNGPWVHLDIWVRLIAHCLLLIALFAVPSRADTTGATFLQIGSGAAPLALGNAYTASAGDIDSLYYNPGGLAALNRPELSITHSDWLEGTEFDVVSYGQPTPVGTLAVGAIRLGGGTEQGRDALRIETGDFTTQDLAVLLGWSRSIDDLAGIGANVKFIHSQIDVNGASDYAFDAGSVIKIPALPVWVGGSVLNLGPGLRFLDQSDPLPLTIAGGAAMKPMERLRLEVDLKREPYDQITELDGGAEWVASIFSFRIGYQSPLQGAVYNSLYTGQNIRGGIGLNISRYRFDYTLAPFGDLGLTQRFTLSVRFGEDRAQPHNLKSLDSSSLTPSSLWGLHPD